MFLANRTLQILLSVQEKLKSLEKTVASLQAQLEAPRSATPKVTALDMIADLIKKTLFQGSSFHRLPSEKRDGGVCWPL